MIFDRVKEFIGEYSNDDLLKLFEDNDKEPESERPEDAEQGVQSIADIEVEDEDNNKEKDSNSDEYTFGAYFSNDAEENDESDENNIEDLDDQPKKKKFKRIRISSSEEEDNQTFSLCDNIFWYKLLLSVQQLFLRWTTMH